MNERIRELAEQAYEQDPLMVINPKTHEPEHRISKDGVTMYHKVFNREKFAELIVRECAKQCLSDDSMRILNHMGVKGEES